MFPNLSTPAIGVNATFEETVELAAQHGFAGVDFSVVEVRNLVTERGIDYIYRLLEENGLRLGGFGLPIDWRNDEGTFHEGLQALPDQAETAQKLCCYRTTTWILPASETLAYEENYQFHLDRLRPVAEVLAAHDIRLGLEFVGPKTVRQTRRYEFIYTLEQMLKLANDVGPSVGLLVDLYHIHTSGGDVRDVHRLRNEDVVYVHVNDALPGVALDKLQDLARALPGETGVTDIGGFLHALDAIGYDGPVTTEPFSERLKSMPAHEAVRETAEAMQRSWQAAGLNW